MRGVRLVIGFCAAGLLLGSSISVGRKSPGFPRGRINYEKLALPVSRFPDMILRRTGFTVGLDTARRQARWVAYLLTGNELVKEAKRDDHFFSDEDAGDFVAVDADYRKSGYDRGHLAPAADMAWSAKSMHESFGFINITPQKPGFNRGIWKKIEEQVRKYAEKYDSVWIASGPLFSRADTLKLKGRIPVPGRFFKVLLIHFNGHWQSVAFLLPNEGSQEAFGRFAVSVDSVESISGLDFFSLLPDPVEAETEAVFCPEIWSLN